MNDIIIPILDLTTQYQSIQTEIQEAMNRVLESGRFILGEEVAQFEQAVANYLGVKHAIGVNSGTDALIISLRSLGIGKGDEVITTPFSFFATAEAVSQVGAIPIFVDVEADTFNINPRKIIQKITPQTQAILPVHLYGNPAAIAQIVEIAKTYNLKIVEDCAQSFGAKYEADCVTCQQECSETMRLSQQGKFTGSIGDMGAFSFFPTKNLGAYGDGGLIATDDDQLAESARMLRVHGERKKYHNEMFGYNSRLDALQAAILRVKLKYIDQWNEQRRRVAQEYNERLSAVENLITPTLKKGHVFHQYTVRILGGKRDQLRDRLRDAGIATMIYYPVSQDQLPVYEGRYEKLPVSERLTQEVLSLPIWPELTTANIDTITEVIKTDLA
ncbi:Glutamine--scyllo-inositol transaminase [Halothece sp. PCC 7418]|uniref:DegT/DnrJ/EryC1/StrS family aminotransferase n=1 Tax=Halothece sp. (strain PCC 7418) TaxID=65093 RepID=UPI0002A07355|nr:DegT/DnrJ/EryC1/StrS family aminotransferase [Halothece sp. PCC 7418]AFZ45839.1 Glutamine--scyllo-inositol transaminase [Halothece sp. PCC 7418]